LTSPLEGKQSPQQQYLIVILEGLLDHKALSQSRQWGFQFLLAFIAGSFQIVPPFVILRAAQPGRAGPDTMSPMKKLQILLVDGDPSSRYVARNQIRKHAAWTVAGEAETIGQALELVQARKPDLIVLDHSLAAETRVPVIPRIIASAPKVRFVMLLSNPSEQAVRDDLRAGAMAFLLKLECKNRLADEIKQATSGQRFFSGPISRIILRRFLYPSNGIEKMSEVSEGLTSRELEIVRMITLGKGNKQVAAQLGIAVRTAETHRANVMRKLNLHNLAEVVQYAMVRGLVEIDAAILSPE